METGRARFHLPFVPLCLLEVKSAMVVIVRASMLSGVRMDTGQTGTDDRRQVLIALRPQVPILREFSNQMLSFVKVQKKAGRLGKSRAARKNSHETKPK